MGLGLEANGLGPQAQFKLKARGVGFQGLGLKAIMSAMFAGLLHLFSPDAKDMYSRTRLGILGLKGLY